ncbi:P-loop NTPase fold protein [Streptomyces sp. NBC_00829]|uniref:P-loop NTPase fold protein n=1 Tax=Streptomyces sp. NBC_00829 TaxID=2903679 RepID=UPI0038658E58|nr:P-loop NTPase fold protein [Streptomyces sp. NBC_00829]WTB19094.1 P-loop NTPase fold protein [Streptomyces sp. NBC_00829]
MEDTRASAVASGAAVQVGSSFIGQTFVMHRPTTPFEVPYQLPRPADVFTGRTQEVRQLLEQFAPADDREDEPPAILVTGMGGVGKSSVVLQAAHEAVRRHWFPGGALYLDLHGHAAGAVPVDPSQALESVLRSMGTHPEQIPIDLDSRAAMYHTVLAGAQGAVLLMVDNVATVEQVSPLLPADRRHRVVITSRHRLPSLMALNISLGPLPAAEGLQLLDAAVHRRNPEDSRVADDPEAAELIVQRTGGLPLALAIVAGQLASYPRRQLSELARELVGAEERLEHLGHGEVSVGAAIELSYRSLPEEQRRLLSLLALTVGQRFSTAVVAAGLDTTARDAQHLLGELAAAHLIEETSNSEHWAIHDLIRAYATTVARDVIGEMEQDKVRERILDFTLDHPDVVEGGPSLFTTRIGARPLAGVHSDGPSPEDRLGVVRDVEVLAELIAAVDTLPPLSIALIGNWGAGKSSLMLQIERHIDLLARLSRTRPGRSAFVSSVRQVRFNAWHYSDTNVWTGLITHLFTALASEAEDALGSAPDPQQTRRDRETLRAELEQRKEAEQQLSEQLTAADRAAPAPGRFATLGSPVRSYLVGRAAVRQIAKDLRFSLPVLAMWLSLAGVATGVWLLRGTLTAVITSLLAIAAATTPIRPLLRRLRTAHRDMLAFTERRYSELVTQQRALKTEIGALRERLALVDAAARLGDFLQEHADGTSYRPHQGVLGQAHADLLRLSHDLKAARLQWRTEGTPSPPPLERIVLYVDDLDRCPPDRVVEVLQAVHLMLGLDLFVVVVAVDARWLIHSLRHHHNALFQHENTPTADDTASDANGLATPVDYLDKIFQIPYALNAPAAQTMGRYLRSLLPTSDTDGTPQAPMASSALDPSLTADGIEAERDNSLPLHHEAADPTATVSEPPPGPEPLTRAMEDADLMPQGLRIGAAEIAFMAQLGGLLPTPRAAKRLVNLYRLVRIGMPATDLPAFASSTGPAPYQAVQILLGVLAGNPRAAEELFRRLLACPNDDTLITALLDEPPQNQSAYGRLARVLPAVLRDLQAAFDVPLTVGHYRRWCTDLARYSFHTRDFSPPDMPIGQQ